MDVPTATMTRYAAIIFFAVLGCDSKLPLESPAQDLRPQSYPVESQSARTDNALSTSNANAPQAVQTDDVPHNVQAEPAAMPVPDRFRLPDDRRAINDERLKDVGIHRLESEHLVLLTDLSPEKVKGLPQLADQLFCHLENHFGELPEAPDGSSFQVTGCLISDRTKFEQAELMPIESFTIIHGRHYHYEFWMFDQQDDYYRRHLLLHEFTHCFMTSETGAFDIPPLWYLEGMAEYFATHQRDADNDSAFEFGIMPQSFEGFEGWGRISEFRRSLAVHPTSGNEQNWPLKVTTLQEIMPDTVNEFLSGKQYSGSWAVCWFLQNHPLYKEHFAPLRKLRTRTEFIATNTTLRNDVERRLAVDWKLFQESLLEGFDTERSWPLHAQFPMKASRGEFVLRADHEWQDTGVRLQAGNTVTLTCTGQFAVNDEPKPWISEPQGVSIEYFRGQPLGRVVGILVGAEGGYLSDRIAIGTQREIIADQECSLWLQINDNCASRSNNSGHVDVILQR